MKTVLLAAVLTVASTLGAFAQDTEIRGVISEQFEAFKADDFAKAFTFASPALQSFFMSSENFGRMQRTQAGWRISGVQILEAPGAAV